MRSRGWWLCCVVSSYRAVYKEGASSEMYRPGQARALGSLPYAAVSYCKVDTAQ
jgi:hypothetical protein